MKTDNSTPHSSSVYDSQVRRTIPYYDTFHDESVRLVRAVRPAPRVWLDTGCGTGTLVEKAAAFFPGTRFVLADPSAEMISVAREKTAAFSPRTAFLPPCDSAGLKKAFSGKADVITAIQAHHYLSKGERELATATCREKLAKNGLYITFENVRPRNEHGIKVGKALWRDFQLSCGKAEEAVDAHLKRFDEEYFPITAEEHVSLLEKCGFAHAEIFWYSIMQAGFYAIK